MSEPTSNTPDRDNDVSGADNSQLADMLREGLPSASGIPEIVVLHGGVEIARCPLDRSPLRVGRNPDNDISLEDKMVSRSHAEILRSEEGWVIRDVGSRHKIRYGGRQHEAHLFKDGDGVGIGPYELVFQEIPRAIANDRVMGAGGPTQPAPGSKPLDVRQEPPSPPPPAIKIPGYELVREIGRGGMGRVFEAYQLSTKRRVALKVLLDGPFSTEQARSRFEREVVIVAGLRHANIAQVFESGLHEGHYWFAMEYVEGRSIDAVVRDDGYSVARTVQLMVKVCDAIGYAHEQGVVHRDLSPGNILVSPDGEPHVVDFGLAKNLSPGMDSEQTISLRGDLLGTPAYMSPEQTARNAGPVDARTDVYSLGVIAYRLVTGGYPYKAHGRIDEIIKEIATAEPKPPRSYSDSISVELESIILKTLEKDPNERYPDAKALREDLQRMLAGQPVAAMLGRRSYWLRRRMRSGRKLAIGVGGVAALIVIGLLVWQQVGGQESATGDVSTGRVPVVNAKSDPQAEAEPSEPPLTPEQEAQEGRATILVGRIQRAMEAEDWPIAKRALDELQANHAETRVVRDLSTQLGGWTYDIEAGLNSVGQSEEEAKLLYERLKAAMEREAWAEAERMLESLRTEYEDTDVFAESVLEIDEWLAKVRSERRATYAEALLEDIEKTIAAEQWLQAREMIAQFRDDYGQLPVAVRANQRLTQWETLIETSLAAVENEKQAAAVLQEYEAAVQKEQPILAEKLLARLLEEFKDTKTVAGRHPQLQSAYQELHSTRISKASQRQKEARELEIEAKQLMRDEKWIQAQTALNRLLAEYPDTQLVQSGEREVNHLLRQIRRRIDNAKDMEVTNEYIIDHDFKLTNAWRKAQSEVERFLRGSEDKETYRRTIILPRFFVEDESLESRFSVYVQNGRTWSCCWGYSGSRGIDNGGFVLATPDRDWTRGPLEFTPYSLYHFNTPIPFDVEASQVTIPGEITIRRVPEELRGTLLVKLDPEEGLTLQGGTLHVARRYYKYGIERPIKDEREFEFPGVGAGTCSIMAIRENQFTSPSLKFTIHAQEKTEAVVPVFAIRELVISYRFRHPSTTEHWKTGLLRARSGDYWDARETWGMGHSVFKLEWLKSGCQIEEFNSVIMPIPEELFEAGRFPDDEEWESPERQHPLSLGSCFAIQRPGNKKWQALLRVEQIKPLMRLSSAGE